MRVLFRTLVAVGLLYIAARHVIRYFRLVMHKRSIFTLPDQLLATFKTTSNFSKIVTNFCVHHIYNYKHKRTTWKHCHVYHVDRGCPRGHNLVTHCSKNALVWNLPGELKCAVHTP